jgi:choline dehydrogenase-like flavoprotein
MVRSQRRTPEGLFLSHPDAAKDLALSARSPQDTDSGRGGTAKMRPENAPMAVVDQYCCVRGVEGLRVVDESIVPNIVRANTNLTCIPIGERVADWMRNSR